MSRSCDYSSLKERDRDKGWRRCASLLLSALAAFGQRRMAPSRSRIGRRLDLPPNTSRSSTTADDCTRPSATEPRSKHSPTTEPRQPPQRDQPEDLSKTLDTAYPGPEADRPLPATIS